MRIPDEDVLKTFRGLGRCQWCNSLCLRLEPHHWIARGKRDENRLDIPINLIALGGPWDCNCHGKAHNGVLGARPDLSSREAVLRRIAQREGQNVEIIRSELYRLVRLPTPWAHKRRARQ